MPGLLQQIVSGVATGSIYACLGLALVMIYQSTHRINFAQGEMAMFSTYIAWALLSWGVSYWVAFVLTIVISFVGGFLIERIVLRPLGRAPVLSSVVVFVGLLVIFNSVAGWIFNYSLKQFPSPFPDTRPFGSTLISFHELGMMGVTSPSWCFSTSSCSSPRWARDAGGGAEPRFKPPIGHTSEPDAVHRMGFGGCDRRDRRHDDRANRIP
jgi:branched-subunit amino acid ABC-type transport system permease component